MQLRLQLGVRRLHLRVLGIPCDVAVHDVDDAVVLAEGPALLRLPVIHQLQILNILAADAAQGGQADHGPELLRRP